jgi:hypothetical protein
VHVRPRTLFPCFPLQQSQGATNDIARLLVLTAVGFDDSEVFFCGTEPDTHRVIVQQLLNRRHRGHAQSDNAPCERASTDPRGHDHGGFAVDGEFYLSWWVKISVMCATSAERGRL